MTITLHKMPLTFVYALLWRILALSTVFAAVIEPAIVPGTDLPLSVFDDPAITRKAATADLGALTTKAIAVNDQAVFRFFADAVYTVRVTRVSGGYNGALIVEAEDSRNPASLFRQVTADGRTHTELDNRQDARLYQVRTRHDGLLEVAEYDRQRAGAVVPTGPLPLPAGSDASAPLTALSSYFEEEAATLSTPTEIDIMLVFDQSAQSWAGANGGVTALANAFVSKMNTAHALSGTECSFRLVHIYLSDHTYDPATPLADELYDIYYKRGGFHDVSNLRDAVGADLAAALVDTGSAYGSTGIGFMPGGPSGSSSAAYSVNAVRAVNNGHTLTHEVGHNLGCGHAKSMTTQPGPGIFSYAAGWYFTGSNATKYHTIMSYNSNNGITYSPCGLFSSPLLTFQGTVAGHATNGDNARCIRNMKSVVAAYRAAVFTTVSTPVFQPASGTAFSGSLSVTISCATSGAEIRYTTDGSEPHSGSTLYTAPLTITASTTFKAAGFKIGMESSAVTTAGYSRIAANDHFADAEPVFGTTGSLWGNTIDCTKESGEPNHYYTTRASAWWRWTAPKSGEATFNTYGSSFDTTLAAYAGTSLATLTQLAANDDSGGTWQSEVTFTVTSGEIYHIVVDGYNGAQGAVLLNWSLDYLEIEESEVVGIPGDRSFRLRFNAAAGETYAVQYRDSLDSAHPWQPFSPPLQLTAGAGGSYVIDVAIPPGGGQRFFRVVRQ